MKKLLAVSSLAVLLSGCNATPYKSGYSETQLNHGVYKITARVDGFSPRNRAGDIALLRAAELACNHKMTYFDVLNDNTQLDNQLTYKFLTVQLRPDDGMYNAKLLMKNLSVKLDTKTDCTF